MDLRLSQGWRYLKISGHHWWLTEVREMSMSGGNKPMTVRHTTYDDDKMCARRMWGRSLSPSLMVKPEPSRTCQVALYALSLSRISFDHRGISRLWKFGKFAFWTTVHAAVIFACQSAFCCWRMGSRAGSKFKPMFSSLIWGPNHSQLSYKAHYRIIQSDAFFLHLQSWKKNDTGILRRRKRMQPSAISSMRQEARSTFRTGCQAPECEGNWSRSFCKPLSATNSCNIAATSTHITTHYDIDRIWNSDFLCLPKALTSKPVSMSLPMFLMYLFASNIAQR